MKKLLLILIVLLTFSCSKDDEHIEEFVVTCDRTPLTLKVGDPVEIEFNLEQYVDENITYYIDTWVQKPTVDSYLKVDGYFVFKNVTYKNPTPDNLALGVQVGKNTFTYVPQETIVDGELVFIVYRKYSNPVDNTVAYGKEVKIPVTEILK